MDAQKKKTRFGCDSHPATSHSGFTTWWNEQTVNMQNPLHRWRLRHTLGERMREDLQKRDEGGESKRHKGVCLSFDARLLFLKHVHLPALLDVFGSPITTFMCLTFNAFDILTTLLLFTFTLKRWRSGRETYRLSVWGRERIQTRRPFINKSQSSSSILSQLWWAPMSRQSRVRNCKLKGERDRSCYCNVWKETIRLHSPLSRQWSSQMGWLARLTNRAGREDPDVTEISALCSVITQITFKYVSISSAPWAITGSRVEAREENSTNAAMEPGKYASAEGSSISQVAGIEFEWQSCWNSATGRCVLHIELNRITLSQTWTLADCPQQIKRTFRLLVFDVFAWRRRILWIRAGFGCL